MPSRLSLATASPAAAGTFLASTTYSLPGAAPLIRRRICSAGRPSGPASLAAASARLLGGISGGSANTRSVRAVMASTVPSLAVIAPRTAGMGITFRRWVAAFFW